MFNETTYLSALGDYVHAGDQLYYAATIAEVAGTWARALADFRAKVGGEGFGISRLEENKDAASIAANVTAPSDFTDSSDVKGLLDGIANEAGFRLRASMIRAGARPLAGAPQSPWSNPLETAGTFWGSEIGQGATGFWNSLTASDGSGPGLMALLAIGLGVLFLLRR